MCSSAGGGETLVEILHRHERAWEDRPFVRALYHEWFEQIRARLSAGPGDTVELGGGLGRLRDVIPHAVVTDVEPTPWASAVVDAEDLGYEDATVANLVLVDVFHHLPRPKRFLDEAARTLRDGGRVVMLEPYCSPLSTIAYRRFHHEPVDTSADPFDETAKSAPTAMDSNSALPTLAFFRERGRFERLWPMLRIVETQRLALLAYPLSGGFSRPSLAPVQMLPVLRALERALTPLAPLAAFRCLIVLERLSR